MYNNKYDLQQILEKNIENVTAFKRSPLMQLIQDVALENSESRKRLLDCIQVFSNYFQKTIMLRRVFNDDSQHFKVAQEHLAEEFGHDMSLMADRNNREVVWDPVLEASSAWFAWKMLTLDNYEKTLLIHLVLEESANIFFVEANNVMLKYKETDYFAVHAEVDSHHSTMGISLLKDLTSLQYANLAIIQQQGWDMLNVVCKRIAELSRDNRLHQKLADK